jgi:hypothetical protein
MPLETFGWAGAFTGTRASSKRLALLKKDRAMHKSLRLLLPFPSLIAVSMCCLPRLADAFCGFYVGRADATLFNEASQVAIVRDGDRTVLTMSNDYKGELTDFALVVPVPSVLTKEQIHVGERKYLERLDAYSAPRLVEYHDPDPCAVVYREEIVMLGTRAAPAAGKKDSQNKALGVTVEARYTVGEYDILILSAKESSGLETWLRESGYKIPPKASAALAPYIRQDMKFFVAKVNLKNQKATGFTYLRPLQIAYESPKFMLPIRLGMANASGPQDLVIYTLTRNGRVESTNYRTAQMPTGMDIPIFVKDEFAQFYRAAFEHAHQREGKRALLTEYAWNMAWCDPCAANPLTPEELGQLGVFWVDGSAMGGRYRTPLASSPVFLTRLHLRYDAEHFPEDLVFQETGNQENFQARYVLRHAFQGSSSCSAAEDYKRQVEQRHNHEANVLADLTGWDVGTIRKKMGVGTAPANDRPWYKRLWQ